MSRPAATAFLLMSAALLAAPIAAAREPDPYRIAPGPRVRARTAPADGPVAGRAALLGLTVVVEHLEPARRLEVIRSIGPRTDDPFASPPGAPERFVTFLVTFDNASGSGVVFQPGNVVLVTNRNEQQFPIDLTDVYLEAERASARDPQQAYDRAAQLIFDGSTLIPDGARRSRLMAFRALPRKWKEFRLHFSFLQIGTETHTLSFAFHKQPLED